MTSVSIRRAVVNPYVWIKSGALVALVYINLGHLLPYVTNLWQDAHTVSTFTVTPAMRAQLVDSLADTVSRHYVDAEQGAQIAAFVRKAAQEREYDVWNTPGEITHALTQDMQLATGDLHMKVEFSAPEVPDAGAPGAGTPASLPARLIDRIGRRMADFGVKEAGEAASGIGYLKLTGFFPASLASEKYAAAMNRVADTRALIIDLRSNGGGKADSATLLAAYFFDQPTHLADIEAPHAHARDEIWTRKEVEGRRYGSARPVVILTSRVTAAAAEHFAYALQTQKRAIVIGQPTRGAAQPTASFRLAPHFVVEMPVARVVSPVTHANWEGRGVQPDIVVPAREALDVATQRLLRRQPAARPVPRT